MTTDKQLVMLQDTISRYRDTLTATEKELDQVLKEIEEGKFIPKEHAKAAAEFLESIILMTGKIQAQYESLQLGELPELIVKAETEVKETLDSITKKREIFLRFCSLYTQDETAAPELTAEQEQAKKEDPSDHERFSSFLSALDAVNGKDGKVDIIALTQNFKPGLLNALFSRKISEAEKAISVFCSEEPCTAEPSLNSETAVNVTEDNAETTESDKNQQISTEHVATAATHPSLAEPEGETKESKTALNENISALIESSLPAHESAVTEENVTEYNSCKELFDRYEQEKLVFDMPDPKNYTLPERTIDFLFPEYQLKTRPKATGKDYHTVIKSLRNGPLNQYFAAFRKYGSINDKIAAYSAGTDIAQSGGALTRLHNTGFIYKIITEDGSCYYTLHSSRIGKEPEIAYDPKDLPIPFPASSVYTKTYPENRKESFNQWLKCLTTEEMIQALPDDCYFTAVREFKDYFLIIFADKKQAGIIIHVMNAEEKTFLSLGHELMKAIYITTKTVDETVDITKFHLIVSSVAKDEATATTSYVSDLIQTAGFNLASAPLRLHHTNCKELSRMITESSTTVLAIEGNDYDETEEYDEEFIPTSVNPADMEPFVVEDNDTETEYSSFTIKDKKNNPKNIKMILHSLEHGGLNIYDRAFDSLGAVSSNLIERYTGHAKEQVESSITRLYQAGLLYKVVPDKGKTICFLRGNPFSSYLVETESEFFVYQTKSEILSEIYDVYESFYIVSSYTNEDTFSITFEYDEEMYIIAFAEKTTEKALSSIARYMLKVFKEEFSEECDSKSIYLVAASTTEKKAVSVASALTNIIYKNNLCLGSLPEIAWGHNPESIAKEVKNSVETILDTWTPVYYESKKALLETIDETNPGRNTALHQMSELLKKANTSDTHHSSDKSSTNHKNDKDDNKKDSKETEVCKSHGNTGNSQLNNDPDNSKKEMTGNAENKENPSDDHKKEPVIQKKSEAPEIQKEEPVNKTDVTSEHKKLDTEHITKALFPLLKHNRYYTIFPYMRADDSMKDSAFCRMASHAFDEPCEKHTYSSMMLDSVFSDEMDQDVNQLLYVAAALRTLCLPSEESDYGAGAVYDNALGYTGSVNANSLNSLLYAVSNFKKKDRKGIWYHANRTMNGAESETRMAEIKKEAAKYYNEYIENYIRAEKSNPRYMFFVKELFDRKEPLAQLLEIVKADDRSMLDLATDELKSLFIRDGVPVDPDNVDIFKINAFIDELWVNAGNAMRHQMKGTRLYGSLRKSIINKIQRISETVASWIVAVESMEQSGNDRYADDYRRNSKKWAELASQAYEEILPYTKDQNKAVGAYAILTVLKETNERILGHFNNLNHKYFYIGFLEDGNVLLNEDLTPDMTGRSRKVEGFTLKERIEAHAVSTLKKEALSERLKMIMESDDQYTHDYGSALQICEYLEKRDNVTMASEIAEIESFCGDTGIKYLLETFREDIELAQGYGMLDTSDDRKETIITDVQECYDHCCTSNNYGFFHSLLANYREQINKDSDARKKAVQDMYDKITRSESGYEVSDKLKAHIEKMMSVRNYTVAEDLIGRIQLGDITEQDYSMDLDFDYLSDFNKNFNTYYRMETLRPKSATPALVENWIKSGKHVIGESGMKKLLETLGFRSPSVYRAGSKTEETYEVKLSAPKSGRRNAYTHPIAAFGSEAEKVQFNVVCLYGNYSVQELIAALKNNGISRHTIVFLASKLTLSERHTLARRMRTELSEKTILILDRPLLMYLAMNCRPAVIQQAFMQIAVPYSFYQPYVPASTNDIRIEVFNGRKRELEEIESPTGTNILYGGRQLGKSALLKMAAHEIDKNENGDRAVLVDIRSLGVEKSAAEVSDALIHSKIIPEEAATSDWNDLAKAIRTALLKPDAPPYLLLMLDEADTFIEDCKNYNYAPLGRLKSLQEMPGNRFKFVIAGLRDVVRFSKGQASDNNSVLPQLKTITVRPFEYQEARSLIEEPLWYLGFRFNEKTEPLVNTILANTNYFPGLIQLYCAKLVDALKNHDYAGYDPAHTPPFELTERHIKKILADESFTREVREKYFITLRLANDNYYYIIALLMADLYMRNGTDGYSAADIWNIANEFSVAKIADLDIETIHALIEEMCELNVFRRSVGNASKYIFSRYNFYQMLGQSIEAVEDEIAKYME